MKVLVIDVGGTNVKVDLPDDGRDPLKIPSGKDMSAAQMVAAVKKATAGWDYQAVSIGFPGPVKNDGPAREPRNLGAGWVNFDFAKAFGKPVKVVNDAAMQAMGSYQGGRMLFLGLGTGLGSALVTDGVLAPLELAHLPYRKGTYEDYLGLRGYKRLGAKKWTEQVAKVVAILRDGLQVEYVVLGGGQVKKLKALPQGVRLGDNQNAFIGGVRMWDPPDERAAHVPARPPAAAAPAPKA
jgi:predicted NBD/HSP70 family sugar kinase